MPGQRRHARRQATVVVQQARAGQHRRAVAMHQGAALRGWAIFIAVSSLLKK
jgi:hypothetical protein